jgi:DNA mismatch endonuclease (patch repair protein)
LKLADVHDRQTRSRNMAAIRDRDTKPELLVRHGLHARGFRYRLQNRKLHGRPDLVFPKHSALIFVHGCFWHGHDCPLFKWPKTRPKFWREKIQSNVERDLRNEEVLAASGWRVGKVWECATRGPGRLDFDFILDLLSEWLVSGPERVSIQGVAQDTSETRA